MTNELPAAPVVETIDGTAQRRNSAVAASGRVGYASIRPPRQTPTMKWSTAALLFLAILTLMVTNSYNFFFHQPFFEIDDWAANSISVTRAKHFTELYGNYSRWGFHHPGPAFFYLYALGEWLFYDTLHLVAAPFNGQLFVHLVLMTGYFVVILTVFSRSLPSGGKPWFLPAALVLSAMHFSAMADLAPDLSYTLHAPSAIASPWSAHALVMPILCLLTVGASVAAGKGQYLPLLAFTDGCLIHTHVAQPLFIVPLSCMAYAGLCWQGWRRRRRAPWSEFAGSHVAALAILTLFALPIIGDFFRGPQSNFALILHHLRTHHGEHKPLARSFFYFLQFGSYSEYTPNRNDFGHYDLPGAFAYLRKYAAYYIMWLAVAALALRPLVIFLGHRRVAEEGPGAAEPGTRLFLAWGGVFLVMGFGLTLFWGTIQDGPMTYFNSWFNYSIYQFAALLALAALCARSEAAGTPWKWWATRLTGAAAVLLTCFLLAGALRIDDPVTDRDIAARAAVKQAVADATVPGRPTATKLLLFTQETWEIATGVALQLQRAGQPFVVLDQWVVVVGEEHRWKDFPANTLLDHLQLFRLHARLAGTARQPAYALWKVGAALTIVPSAIAPSDPKESVIEFRPEGNNFLGYQVIGFSGREKWGLWNDGRIALLALHPESAGGRDVRVSLDAYPFTVPKHGLAQQSFQVFFNGEQIGHEHTFSQPETDIDFTIPSGQWERAAAEPLVTPSTLEFRFPTAMPPHLVDPEDPNNDMRTLAVGFRQIHFREVEPPPLEAWNHVVPRRLDDAASYPLQSLQDVISGSYGDGVPAAAADQSAPLPPEKTGKKSMARKPPPKRR